MRVALFASTLALMMGGAAHAEVCKAWSPAQAYGELDTKLVNEASGLDVSAKYPGRLYHNNDSGDDLRFYVSDLTGQNTRAVDVEGPKPQDIEDLSVGPCDGGTCIYLGDIGDNPARREDVVFTLVKERNTFEDKVKPLRTVRARYPDGPHNAEAFALHPNGDLFLVTKPADRVMMTPVPAKVYKLTAAQLREPGQTQTFAKIGEIVLPSVMATQAFPGSISTALDISADGKRAILLTYMSALEIGMDFKNGLPPFSQWVEGRDYKVIALDSLPQQEAAAWLPGDKSFIYDTEATRGSKGAPIREVRCND